MLKLFIVFIVISVGINYYVSAKGYTGPKSDHFDGTRFHNLTASSTPSSEIVDEPEINMSFFSFIVQKFKTSWGEKTLLNNTPTIPAKKVEGREIVVTFINHATVLIQTEGLNIITDPVWANRASPFSFFGPKRHMPAGVNFDDLPSIDIVLLSHNHYDHMDVDILKKLSKRDNPAIYTGLGNKAYLEQRGITNVFEMDWGDRKTYSDSISVESVPAQHFSARGLTDRNKTLWTGFVVQTQNGNIYFAGDTGYGPFIERIKKAYPEGFRLALLPIGAYEPRNFMKTMHMGPEDAIRMYSDLKVQEAVSIHFGTFNLSLESQTNPVDRLKELLNKQENKNEKWDILWNGESADLK